MAQQSEAVEALVWQAAAGDTDAQYALGMALLYGRGVDKNGAKGIEWLRTAAAGGNQAAAEYLKQLKTRR